MVWVARALKTHPVPPPAMGTDTFYYTRLPQALSSLALHTSIWDTFPATCSATGATCSKGLIEHSAVTEYKSWRGHKDFVPNGERQWETELSHRARKGCAQNQMDQCSSILGRGSCL